ncbi:MAG TPA: pyridoxal phosphate-dependent aminotransferase [Caldilineae bacterium]|nr:pyridoxal phosphate-dependent aminotransferase [Caldilineae bacterium]
MPEFDFDAPIDRRHSDSVKWDYPNDILPMWVADTDFMAPPAVIEALHRRVNHGVFGYHRESPTLRQTVVQWVAERYGWDIEPEWLIFPPDVMVGMNWAAQMVARPGDGVLLQSPVYRPFFRLVRYGGFTLQDAPLAEDASGRWRMELAALERAADDRTRVFLLCNPQNPTGRVFTRAELESLAQFCFERDILILADEIHADLIYAESHHIPIASLGPDIAARTITFIAPSKTFNIAGLKSAVGIIPNPELRERMEASARGLIPVINVLGMTAMEAAYREGGPWLDAMLAYLQKNRDHLLGVIDAGRLPGVRMARPDGTFLAWLDFRNTPWADAPARHILEKARVLLNEGDWFGDRGRGFVRLNFGCPRATLDEGIERIARALRRA